MEEILEWFQQLQVERTVAALQKNNFAAQFAKNSADALREIFGMIPEGATVGVGGSATLAQIGFFDEAPRRQIRVLNPSPELSMEEFLEMRRQMFLADVYLTSSNAVTEDGKLYNIDGTGNRVAAMTFGPKRVIVVCGINKVVKDLDEAMRRAQNHAAPMNAKRLGLGTPCAKTGVCADCSSPQRICNAYVVTAKKPLRTDVHVLLVGEPLGF